MKSKNSSSSPVRISMFIVTKNRKFQVIISR